MEDRSRDNKGFIHGETPVQYRYEFRFAEPISSYKKIEGLTEAGTRDMFQVEFFGNDPNTFIFLHTMFSRMGVPMERAQAVKLADGSVVNWVDENAHEEE